MSDRKHRDVECPACHATPSNMDQRIITGSVDGTTTTTWHRNDCPRYDDPRPDQATQREEGPARLRLVRPDEEPTA